MRKIDWEAALSKDDIVWLRQTGIPGIEERIERHQAQFDAEVPDSEVLDDVTTKSADDPTVRAGETVVEGGGGPQMVDPTGGGAVEADDDYPKWTVAELAGEVTARNDLPNTTPVEVVGTGKDGAVTKADLVKGLRLWDQMNPGQ